MSPRALLALAVLLALATPVAPLPTDASGVVELNDLNFDSYVDGRSTWLIAVLAPGCGACAKLHLPLEDAARELFPHVRVGKFDVSANPTLFRRFAVFVMPSIVLVRGGETRDMDVFGISATALVHFAESGWRRSEPRIACASPSSTCGRAIGRAVTAPLRVHAALKRMHEDLGYSSAALLLGSLLATVGTGIVLVALADLYCCHGPIVKRRPTPVRASA